MLRKCKCAETCDNFIPVEQPKSKFGKYVVSDKGYLCVAKQDAMSPESGNLDYYIISSDEKLIDYSNIVPLSIGLRFKTRCAESIFPDTMGEFVVMKKGCPIAGELFLESTGYVYKASFTWKIGSGSRFIVLPSIASGWWDMEITRNLTARAFEHINKVIVRWTGDDGSGNATYLPYDTKSDFVDAIISRMKVIPKRLHMLEVPTKAVTDVVTGLEGGE